MLLSPEVLAAADAPTLLATYAHILRELRTRGIVRTNNAPAGDYAEHLVLNAFGGELASNSEKSWDVRTAEGKRLQVKARVVTRVDVPGERQLSVFRSFDFDDAAVILFDASYAIRRAALMPAELVRAHSSYRAHVNGHVLMARDALFSEPGVRDVTALVAGHSAAQPPPSSTR